MPDDQHEDEKSDGVEWRRERTARLLSFGGLLLFLGLMQFIWAQSQYARLLTIYPSDSNLIELDPAYVSFHLRRLGLGLMCTAVVVVLIGLYCKQSRSYSRHSNNPLRDTSSAASSNLDFLAEDATWEEEQET